LTPPGHGYEHSPDMKSNRLRCARAAEAMRKRERRREAEARARRAGADCTREAGLAAEGGA
jgi:hypothetical protein